jgi:hypothetical protein
MVRWLLALVLMVVGSSVASAQGQDQASGAGQGQPAAALSAATDKADVAVRDADHRVAQLALYRASLKKRYRDELDAIDRLKNQRASWRRDRELRDSLSSSNDTASQLSAADREIDKANAALLVAGRAHLTAIDRELAAGTAPARARQLERSRNALAQQLKDAPHRIMIPDLEIDPLADPEELEQRATELRASEAELNRQLVGLDQQATELEHLASLRKQHSRAGDVFYRDDDQPQRSASHKAGEVGGTADDGTGTLDPSRGLPGAGPGPAGGTSSFESYVPTVLAEVIDASTITSFAAAQRSGDPSQRAAAAHKAHDAVAQRLEQVKRKRAEIEARARQLRGKR